MDEQIYQKYLDVLSEELVPAMGCTEPIAIAYAAALARQALGCMPEQVTVKASANIIKNVKSVVVPNTGGKRGIAAAAAAGIVAGNADGQLQVLANVTKEQIIAMDAFMAETICKVEQSEKPYLFDIQVLVTGGGHTAFSEISGQHTNVICLMRNGETLLSRDYSDDTDGSCTNRSFLSVEGITEFADCVKTDDISELLQRQIDLNMQIAEEGLRGNWGANIGSVLLNAYGNGVHNRAKVYAAAASDARMNGCELPVIINSGSGNQGLTASLPVIIYAEELNVSTDQLYRALAVSNLVTIHLKTGIGRLSAYCGATSSGCGAAAGVTYLFGGKYNEIAHTVANAITINSGMICDGAKSSCAAKIASAVEAGLLGMQMQMHNREFVGGDGLVRKGVENTIENISLMARDGMRETDGQIISLMLKH